MVVCRSGGEALAVVTTVGGMIGIATAAFCAVATDVCVGKTLHVHVQAI
jgi:hypothetical protein